MHQAQLTAGLSVPSSIPLLSCTQVDLINEIKRLCQFLWMLRRDEDTSAFRQHQRTAGCTGAPAFALQNPEVFLQQQGSQPSLQPRKSYLFVRAAEQQQLM